VSSRFMIFITINTTFSVQKCYASFDVMFICALNVTLIFSTEFDHVIELMTLKALYNVTVLFKQFTFALLICI